MGVKLSTTVEQTLRFPPPSLTQQSVLVKKQCWRWVVGGTHEVAKGSSQNLIIIHIIITGPI